MSELGNNHWPGSACPLLLGGQSYLEATRVSHCEFALNSIVEFVSSTLNFIVGGCGTGTRKGNADEYMRLQDTIWWKLVCNASTTAKVLKDEGQSLLVESLRK